MLFIKNFTIFQFLDIVKQSMKYAVTRFKPDEKHIYASIKPGNTYFIFRPHICYGMAV